MADKDQCPIGIDGHEKYKTNLKIQGHSFLYIKDVLLNWEHLNQVEELSDIFNVLGTSHFHTVNNEPPGDETKYVFLHRGC